MKWASVLMVCSSVICGSVALADDDEFTRTSLVGLSGVHVMVSNNAERLR